jgi:hypothetical protein
VAAQKPTPVSGLLERASTYVCRFVHEFSTVVAEERYLQESRSTADGDRLIGAGVDAAQRTDLRSDFLFIGTVSARGWLTFRDVYSVNGRPVRDREERLAGLFLNPAPDAVDHARRISHEGYRYNIGSPDRTVANPLVALGFLQPDYRDHFEFIVSGIDTARGTDTWTLKFKERMRPTILRSKDDRDVGTSGRLWIDGATGRVLQTELDTSTGDRVMTTFGHDERLQLDVPVEMRDITWFNRTPITGVATYSNFRRFNVATDEQFR